jgi:N-acetylglucosamine repressor
MQYNRRKVDSIIANVDQIKQINSASIYKVIETHAPISRVKISQVSKLAPASVTKITRQLLVNGIISETERQASTGGRCAISLELNTEKVNVIAMRISRKHLTVSRYNLAGEISSNVKLLIENISVDALIALIFKEIKKIITLVESKGGKISAIAITLSGLIDPERGIVSYSPYHPFKDFALSAVISDQFAIPTFIGNHLRSLALAEHYFGAAQDCKDSILIGIHDGVGSGILVDSQLLKCKNSHVGEIGHIQVNPAGTQCHCGNYGCLETEINDRVLVQKVVDAVKGGAHSSVNVDTLTPDALFLAAKNNDPVCQKIVSDAANYLGKTISSLINILNPEKIIITGKICKAENVLFSTIQTCVKNETLPVFQSDVSIHAAELDPKTNLAAFSLVKREIYEGDLLLKLKV